MQQILNHLKNKYPGGSDSIDDDSRREIRELIGRARRKERRMLSKQVISFMEPGRDVSHCRYRHLDANEKKLVDRLGFFKYGHLMSEEDVNDLGDADLISDYQCIKIQEENVMENIGQISAIWGALNPYNKETMAIVDSSNTIAQLRAENEQLRSQLSQTQPKAMPGRKFKDRHPAKSIQQKQSRPKGKTTQQKAQASGTSSKNKYRQWPKK
jgi:hypothetical protein